MTTIAEEPELATGIDFTQLLDYDGTADGNALVDSLPDAYSAPKPSHSICPAHDGKDCLCHGFMGDFGFKEAAPAPSPTPASGPGVDEPDYSRFENWIPRFIWPEKPCDYCRTRRMNCFLSRGQAGCNACLSLFRECSFTNTRTLEAFNQTEDGTSELIDTLHAVDEDTVRDYGNLTGIKPLASKGRVSGTSTPSQDDAPGSSKRNGIRFPRHAVKVLREWLDAHADRPYPSEREKVELEQRTELKPSQIANWLANARRRRKVTEKSRPRRCSSPSLQPTTPAIDITTTPEKPWEELNPFERWKHSPPENEPAAITDIAQAVANSDLPEGNASRSPSSGRRKKSSNGSGFSSFKATSTTSIETSNRSSSISSTAISRGSSHSHGSFGSFNSSLAGKRDRRRRKRTGAPAKSSPTDDKKRIFQCTFCTDTFKSKYDWTRHEKSLHLSLEKWICAPLGAVVPDAETNAKKCAYCEERGPSSDHVEAHNHRQCEDKGADARTFYRKDHLRQHMRLMHGCEMLPAMEKWKFAATTINSRCGFCAQRFSTWQGRVDHLTAHFKAGARMIEWKGCRGLDPAVAAQVTNAMPPYLIGIEAASPYPFSATNRITWDQTRPDERGPHDNANASCNFKATYWEILTVRLGKYANEMNRKGVVLTDDMLQQQARRIIYDCDDAWNQTSADNAEWLDLFKKAHGLDYLPSTIGGSGSQIPEDLETYGDLGLRIPFVLQLQAYNKSQAVETSRDSQAGIYDKTEGYVDSEYLEKLQAARSRSQCIGGITQKEVAEKCDCHGKDGSQARAQGLAALSGYVDGRIEGCECDAPKSRGKGTCLPRHKLQLPPERARQFATITPAWQQSGMMPKAVPTARLPHLSEAATSAGGVMNMFDPELGGTRSLNADEPSHHGDDWTSGLADPTDDHQMLKDLDDLIAATSGPQASSTTDTPRDPSHDPLDASWLMEDETLQLSEGIDMPTDLVMEDLDFDDITFGGAYDTGPDVSFGNP